jgi:tetratricopeptide (TPR) repeat protein
MGRYGEALQFFDRALSHNPALHEALVYKGLISSNFGKHSEALVLYDRALATGPGSAPAWFARGLTLAILERYDEAILAYERALSLDPQHIDALTGISSAMKKRDRVKWQIESSSQPAAALQSPDNLRIIVPQERPALLRNIPDGGIVPVHPPENPAIRTSQPVPANSAMPDLFCRTAHTSMAQPDPVVQRETPRTAMSRKTEPTSSHQPSASGSTTLYNEMIDQLHQTLAVNPQDSGSWHTLGDQFLRIGKYQQATEAYERALEYDPERTGTWTALGDARKKMGIYDEALFAYEQALAIDAEQTATWISHAKTLAMLGRYPEAVRSCDRATTLEETNIDAWLYKGFILKKISRHEDALTAYNHVLAINPHHEPATRQRRSLIGGE